MPRAARESLHRALAPYREEHPGVRWLRPDTWHLTLLFVGAVPVGRVPELTALVEAAAEATAPVEASIDGGDGRVGRRPAAAWLRVASGADRLLALADGLQLSCPADISTAAPRRAPSAHLTVARRADELLIASLRHQRHGPLRVAWLAGRIALMRSHLGPERSRYETLHEATM